MAHIFAYIEHKNGAADDSAAELAAAAKKIDASEAPIDASGTLSDASGAQPETSLTPQTGDIADSPGRGGVCASQLRFAMNSFTPFRFSRSSPR